MTLEQESIALIPKALKLLEESFAEMPAFEPDVDLNALNQVMMEVATKMKHNFPYPHPLYAGQMIKPPHPIARLAYTLALWINPNNHALDGGLASSNMEQEAVGKLAKMFGWSQYLGHLCGGGTMANLEALWVGARIRPGETVIASSQAHYTHQRICDVLNIPFECIAVDQRARMDLGALALRLEQGGVGTVVATMGTTSVGAVDPLPGLIELQKKFGFRIHADAAYGGYFHLTQNLDEETRSAFDLLNAVDSLVIDPHKHGLQPYGCGCILFRDPAVGTHYRHDSPYTYFSSNDLHLGEISLECSRPGAAAVALWATQRMLPMEKGGIFAEGLHGSLRATKAFFARLTKDPRFLTAFPPQLDIVIWAPTSTAASQMTRRSGEIFKQAAKNHLHLAIAHLPRSLMQHHWPNLHWDRDQVTVLRSCLMKPEHESWLDQIWQILDLATTQVLKATEPEH